MMLPSLVRLQFRRWPALWLPLFLFWPVLPFLFLLLFGAVYALEAAFRARRTPYETASACTAGVWRLLCAARGTHVDVEAASVCMKLSIH